MGGTGEAFITVFLGTLLVTSSGVGKRPGDNEYATFNLFIEMTCNPLDTSPDTQSNISGKACLLSPSPSRFLSLYLSLSATPVLEGKWVFESSVNVFIPDILEVFIKFQKLFIFK